MEDIIQIGGMVILGIFMLYLSVSITFGMRRGMKRQLLRFGMIVLCIVLALVITPAIYDSMLETDISSVTNMMGMEDLEAGADGKITIEELVSSSLSGSLGGSEGDDDAVTALGGAVAESMTELLLEVPSVIVNLIIFVFLFFILRFVTWIIFGVLKIFLFSGEKKRKADHRRYPNEYPKVKKYRLIGGGIGVLQGFAIALAVLVPVAAIAGTIDTFAAEVDKARFEAVLGEGISADDIFKLSTMYTESVPGMIYGALGLDKMLYKPLTTVTVGEQSFALEDFAKLGATGINAIGEFDERYAKVENALTEDEAKAAYAELLEFANDTVKSILDNKLVKAILVPVGKAVYENLDVLYPADTEDFMELTLRQVIIDLVGDGTEGNNLAVNLKSDLISIVAIAKDLNAVGALYDIVNAEDFDLSSLLDGEEEVVTAFGKAVDDLLKTKMLKNAKTHLFTYALSSLTEEVNEELPIDVSEVKFEFVSWEKAAVTALKIFRFADEMESGDFGTSTAGARVEDIIASLHEQPSETGLMALFENVIKSLLVQLELDGVDAEFLKDKALMPYENRAKLGGLVDLVFDLQEMNLSAIALDTVEDIASTMEFITTITDRLDGLKAGEGDINEVVDKVVGAFLGEISGIETLDALKETLDVLQVVLEGQEIIKGLGDGETLTPEDLDKLTDLADDVLGLLENPAVLDALENFIPEEYISLPGEYQDVVEGKLADLVAASTDPDELERYGRIAEMFGIDPFDIGL